MGKFKKPAILLYNYGSIISIIIFVIGTFFLAKNIPDYSFTRYSISQIYLFSGPIGQHILSYLFLSKFFLDFIFSISIFKKLPISAFSPAAILWFLPVASFGALGLLPSGRESEYIHLSLTFLMLISWFMSQYVFAKITNNPYFFAFTKKYIVFQVLVVTAFAFISQFNGLFEIVYFLLSLLWLWTFLLVLDLR